MSKERKRFIQHNVGKMSDRRKQIERLFDGSDDSILRIVDRASGRAIGAQYDETAVQRLIDSIGTTGLPIDDAIDLANFAYASEPNFANVIDYLSNIFLWRYYFVPVEMRKTAANADYGQMYQMMTEVVDGMSIEVSFPRILTKLFMEGSVYLYTLRNRSARTVSTILLNPEYCQPVMVSQYQTGIFQFNVTYFDDLGLRQEELEEILELFPSELVDGYNAYKNDRSLGEWVILDGRYATYLNTNEHGFPPYLSVLKSLFDYDKYRKNEVERSSAQLDTIITHEIPSHDNQLLFELEEVRALHKSMSRIIGQNKRTRLMTTFGKVELHPVQEGNKVSNDTLENAHDAVYRTSGLNKSLFSAENKDALLHSLNRDQATVWKYVQQLVNFYNLTINHLYSFKGYQLELTMLPITHNNLREMMEIHRRNGEYGIGRLEAIVASGTKQKHIGAKSKLEEFLKLDEVLQPLSSSHTRSANDDKKESEKPKEEEVDIESPEQVEEPEVSEE